MRRIWVALVVGVLISVCPCADAWAQATAQISGTVRDQSGAVLPGVEVTVTQTDTGIARSTISNETGSYVLPTLAVGPYRLEASLPGFRSYLQTGIVLQVNSSPVTNVTLEVGQVSETIEVQANAALVETRSQSVGQMIENQRILELPLNGRNVQDLITLAGGAVQAATTGDRFVAGSFVFAVGGGVGFATDFSLDGANHMSFLTGVSMPMPFPDATQEFKVETSGLTAQYGRSSAVSAVTKSGTNELHGDLFEFVRNDLFNARSYFATSKSTLKRNQFGGTVGGAVLKNQLFFFGGFQGTTLRQDPADNRAFVPTAAMLAGDWTGITSPACNANRQINLRPPFVNNRIDPSLYVKPAMYVATRLPKATNECGEIIYGRRTVRDEDQYVGKIDYQRSAQHSMFGRIMLSPSDIPNSMAFEPTNLLLSNSVGYTTLASSYTVGDTYLIGSNIVQTFRLAVNRGASHANVEKSFSWCDAGVKMYCWEPKSLGTTNIAGGFAIGSGFATGHKNVSTSYTANDDVSLVRGSHQIAFGASALHGRQVNFNYFAALGQFTFNSQAYGLGQADFFLGRPSSFFTGAPNGHYVRSTWIALYATDTWKATPRVTVNYGLRWEPYLPQIPGAVYNFNYDRFRQGTKSSVYVNAPAGVYYAGDPGFPGKSGVNNQWFEFAPRVGLAWDLAGDGRTSIRASYAYGYAFVPGDYREGPSGGPPWGNRVTLTSPAGGLENPWQDIQGGNPFPYVLDRNVPFTPYGLFYTQAYDLRTPTTQSWNLSVQRQIASEWVLSASYIANRAMHLWTNRSINPATYFPGGPCTLDGITYTTCSAITNTDQRRRFSLEKPSEGRIMGYMAENDDGGTQIYHGMLLSVQRRVSSGVTVNGNYTWSRCVGPYGGIYNPMGPHPSDTYTNPNNRSFDQGNCDTDRRQIFNLTGVAETPQFANPSLRLVATGWRLSGIYRKSSGSPLNVLVGSDRALTGINNQRADQVLVNPYGDKSARPFSNYLNPAAFAPAALGTLGNVGRNSVRGPGTWSFDMALSRVFRFQETQRLEVRAEAFNVMNSFRPLNPNATFSNNTFGVIRTADDPRILQFALKFVF